MDRGPVLSGSGAGAMDTAAACSYDSGHGLSEGVPTSLAPYQDCFPIDPEQWCWEKGCPWCLLGMRKNQHGDLKAAGASFHSMLAWQMQQENYVSDAQLAVPFSALMRTALGLCTAQTSYCSREQPLKISSANSNCGACGRRLRPRCSSPTYRRLASAHLLRATRGDQVRHGDRSGNPRPVQRMRLMAMSRLRRWPSKTRSGPT